MIYLNKCQDPNNISGEYNLRFTGRMIWRDIATWIRAYLVSTYFNSDPELHQAISEKLYSLPLEHGNFLRIFFGDKIAEDNISLLSNYITLLKSVINAQKSGDVNAVNEYTKQLYQNIDQRADYLSQINPFWQSNIVKSLIYNFTNMTIDEATTFLEKDYNRNIKIFDRILSHSTVMGDYLAQGLLDYITYSTRQPIIPKY